MATEQKDRRITLIYFATVTFDQEEIAEYEDDGDRIEMALHCVEDNIKFDLSHGGLDSRENYYAIFETDDDIDEYSLVDEAIAALRRTWYG